MKIAIHHRESSFSERWINYCIDNNLNYVLVNCYASDILNVLKNKNITHLLWHYHHSSSKDLRVAPYVLNTADKIGVKTFPNFSTRWHFDDKVAQKYLLESIDAPLVPSKVYYTKEESEKIIKSEQFPIVAKLRRGAGSTNVKLLNSQSEAKDYINQMFGEGISASGKTLSNLNQKVRVAKKIKNPFNLIKKTYRFILRNKKERKTNDIEKGYFYYQKFMPNNEFDTRVVVVANKAFAIRRFTRKGDFKASGSGLIDYNINEIDEELIKLAFQTSKKLDAQCLAYDFIYNSEGHPRIIEICFSFSMLAYDNCEGFWDDNLKFYRGKFNPQYMMIESLLKETL